MMPAHVHASNPRRLSALKIALLSVLPLLLNQLMFAVSPPPMGMGSQYNDLFGLTRFLSSEASFKPKPRVFYLEEGPRFSQLWAAHPVLELEFQDRIPAELPMPKPHLCYGYSKEECKAPSGGSWQKASYPSCLSFHELDLTSYLAAATAKIVGKGGKRLVWRIEDFVANTTSPSPTSTSNQQAQPVALKMFKFRKNRDLDFSPQSLDYQRKDAVLSSKTDASPYIVNIHGFCGASAIYEFADGGTLQANIDQKGPPRGEELLETAYQLAAGLRDFYQLTSSRKTKKLSVAHADLYGDQFVLVKGEGYKLTDFNLAKFLVRNRTTNLNMPFRRDVVDNWFAPEVHKQGEIKENIVTANMDIWGLGNVLFLLVTGLKPFQGIHRKEVHKMIIKRTALRSPIPGHIQNSNDYAIRVVKQASDWCTREDPEERPAAWQVASFLKDSLQFLRKYDSLEELNNRPNRFPSIHDRVRHYMSGWYHKPCSHEPEAFMHYQPLHNNDVLIQALSEEKGIIKLQAKVQTDNAFLLEPDILDKTSTQLHAGYVADFRETISPFWRALHGKPLVTQWGDKTTFVVDEQHPSLNVPHLKKCRRVLSKAQMDRLASANTCPGAHYDDHPTKTYHQPQPKQDLHPIVWKLDSRRLLGRIELVPNKDRPWNQKRNKAVFRGRLTGNALRPDRSVVYLKDLSSEEEYCDLLQRCRLVRKTSNSSSVDAKLTGMQHKPIRSTISGVALLGNRLTVLELLQYKVLILLEGNDVSSGLGWGLRSNSVVMMPTPTWTSWLMEEMLEPWVHFVPLDTSLDDVEEKMQWVLDNDEEAHQIAHRGSLWVKDLLEHPDSQHDNDEVFKRMLDRYQKHFVYSNDLWAKYAFQSQRYGPRKNRSAAKQ